MAAPKNPNTVNASAVTRRRGEETMAAKMRARGWWAVHPDQIEEIAGRLRATGRYGSEAAAVVSDVLDAAGQNFYPCGCLINSRGAHRGDCPDFETVPSGAARTSNRLDDLTWRRRAGSDATPGSYPSPQTEDVR